MNYTNLPLFNIMKNKMEYLSQRQGVLAQNVANADTPDYKARDITEPDFKAMTKNVSRNASLQLPVAVTDSKHITGSGHGKKIFAIERKDSTYERNPNGNNVVLEQEMMQISQNQAEYQKVLSLYRKSVELFKTALGRPNG
jgi:flagellar basal-body rod protein FlgB